VLGLIETKKCSLFPGYCLEEFETIVAYVAADDQVLGCSHTFKMVAGFEDVLSSLQNLVMGPL
jgi:hypothetical protein